MPKKVYVLIFVCLLFICSNINAQENNIADVIDSKSFNPATLLWYKQPAKKWEEALPVGNGRLGAMVFGNSKEERIQLNEDTYWTGGPYSTVVKGGYKVLPKVQKLVFQGKYLQAHNLFGRNLMGYPVEQQKYQSLGNLVLFFQNQDSVTNYKRWLDLETGITAVSYQANGITYTREVFASAPDGVIAIRITANKPGSISLTANLRGERNQTFSNYATDYFRMDPDGKDGLKLTGKSADYMGVKGQIRYDARLKAIVDVGSVKTDDMNLIVDHANSLTLYLAAATNFVNYKDVSANEHNRVEAYLHKIKNKNYATIRNNAVADYKKYFDRVALNLTTNPNSFEPTDVRKQKIQDSEDAALVALSYNFGRYLMIGSSRPGTQPANLQGIWNEDMNPAWDAKYTTNINTQMNYWPVESGNLSECALPLIKMVNELQDQGSQVAKEHYGARGWVFHQNTDIWRVAAPMDGPTWGTFTVGGAWLCTHLWEHYQYTMDKAYLKEIYPTIKGSVLFFMDFLVKHPNGKWLVTNPSTSPENFPDGGGNKPYFDEVTGGYREGTTICAGSAIDMEILYDLFGYFTEASKVLGIQDPFIAKVMAARAKLVPPQIGSDGSLQEWADDWKSLEKNHRHFSHMYGLYPGKVLYEKRTPELIEAYKKVLNERGDGAMGFSRAWKMALWARLNDGNRSYKIYKGYLKEQCTASMFALCGKSLQVDGALGVSAAITEMLIQSQDNYIKLIPALPDAWNDGTFKGVCTRGAFEFNFTWHDKRVTSIQILSKAGKICKLAYKPDVNITVNGKPVEYKNLPGGIVEFATVKGATYNIQ